MGAYDCDNYNDLMARLGEKRDIKMNTEEQGGRRMTKEEGKWMDGEDEIGAFNIVYTEHICSECGYSYSFPIKYKFCPNCGADMREVAE